MIMLLCPAPLLAAIAQTCGKHSPAHTVALVELCTSEGCSSSLRADRALSQAFSGKPGAKQVVLSRTLQLPGGAVNRNLGVAAFMQTKKGKVLQTLAMPLCSA